MKNPFKKQKNDYDSYDDSYDNGFYRGDDDEEDGLPVERTSLEDGAETIAATPKKEYEFPPPREKSYTASTFSITATVSNSKSNSITETSTILLF